MKKITFIVFALIAGTGFAQESATSEVNATIVSPIIIESTANLNFGSINASTGGNVRVANDGTRTFSNPSMDVNSATTVTAAKFDITAAQDYSYSISIPSTVLSGDGTDMNISFTHNRTGAGNRIGDGSKQVLNVGGLLTVASGQVAGVYDGTVEVTVAYE